MNNHDNFFAENIGASKDIFDPSIISVLGVEDISLGMTPTNGAFTNDYSDQSLSLIEERIIREQEEETQLTRNNQTNSVIDVPDDGTLDNLPLSNNSPLELDALTG